MFTRSEVQEASRDRADLSGSVLPRPI